MVFTGAHGTFAGLPHGAGGVPVRREPTAPPSQGFRISGVIPEDEPPAARTSCGCPQNRDEG
ncbi:hypothetical protein SCATT_20870 [Streptantibioticus cattleyicolor NRRL 8057 = DSM 46488]|uniref:Uncharacterized protein n=1 Tax=Streptantibioticus cattleyicolor (strain ATCC 35852 / DSM 46488 / JCM 4925 / NBRC 14057 / NRRL 8057) TaxID=1003195 RepID=G8WZG1_STREN|nr:hypothetical protein SCATT_20870 [Streptantibioticus cattleyicolor NRRL 8057 = DSM 46488]